MSPLAKTEWEALYKTAKTPWREAADIDNLIKKSGITAGTALDLGCGTGEWAVGLAEKGFIVEALDYSTEALAIARQNPSKVIWAEWNLEDLANYHFLRDQYDLILDHKVLAFIEDKEGYLTAVQEKLAGVYVLTVFHFHDQSTNICVPQAEFDGLILPRFTIVDKAIHPTRPTVSAVTYYLRGRSIKK